MEIFKIFEVIFSSFEDSSSVMPYRRFQFRVIEAFRTERTLYTNAVARAFIQDSTTLALIHA